MTRILQIILSSTTKNNLKKSKERICFTFFSKHIVSEQQINFSLMKQVCICLVNGKTVNFTSVNSVFQILQN